MIKYFPLITLCLALTLGQLPDDFRLNRTFGSEGFEMVSTEGLASNSIRHIRQSPDGQILFIGTGGGLGFADLTSGSMEIGTFDRSQLPLPEGGVPGLVVRGQDIAVSGVVSVETAVGVAPQGMGIGYSTDGGYTWAYKPQPVDSVVNTEYVTTDWGGQQITRLAVTTAVNNVSYDLAIFGDYIYAASWAGGLQRFRFKNIPPAGNGDDPNPWQPIPLPLDSDLQLLCGYIDTDNYILDPRDPEDKGAHNHKGFSVYAIEDTLWVGTAAGINKGVIRSDGCINWLHYDALRDGFSGNWVIGFTHQELTSPSGIPFIRLWAITWSTGGVESYALSYTDDGGTTWNIAWQTEAMGLKVYGLYADSERVIAAAEEGVFISIDGEHWEKIRHPEEAYGEIILSETAYSVTYQQGNGWLWTGTPDGLAYTTDLGTTWEVIRFWSSTSLAETDEDRFYAYPNPFMAGSYQYDGNSTVRFVFAEQNPGKTYLEIYDFSMERVVRLDKYYPAGNEYEFRWNSRNDWGDQVANGVYFCRLTSGDLTYWTKLLVIND